MLVSLTGCRFLLCIDLGLADQEQSDWPIVDLDSENTSNIEQLKEKQTLEIRHKMASHTTDPDS
jgi:hypothetical protein